MKKIKREIVAAMIFSKDERLLLVRKNPSSGGVYIDCWHIPGGGVEENERKEKALQREIIEEVGIDICSYEIKLISDEGRGKSEKIFKETSEKVMVEMHFNVYQVKIRDKDSEEVNVSLEEKELSEYKWFLISELSNVKLTPPSKELFVKLGYIKKGI